MKRILIALLVAVGLCATTEAQTLETNDIGPALLEEVRQMRIAMEKLSDDVAKLRASKSREKALNRTWPDGNSFHSQGPNIQKLAEIEQPDLEDKDQVKKYILEIVEASRGQNSWSDRDPQVRMLTKIGSKNVPALLETLSLTGSMTSYHVKRAINFLADEKSKPLILAALPIHNNLVDVVVQHGWEQEAKESLLDELESPGGHLPTEWITAVANLNDPVSYPLLRAYFINGPNRYWTYKVIKDMPIADMPGAVAEAWERSQFSDDCTRQYMAIAALSYGHVDALATLIDILADEKPSDQWMAREIRPAIFQVIDFRGSNDDLAEWFSSHRDQLRFDTETKKFVVDE